MKRQSFALLAVLVIATASLAGAPGDRMVGINVVLKSAPTQAALATLGTYGKVRDIIPEINGLTMQVAQSRAAAVGALPFVEAWGFDQERKAIPVMKLPYPDTSAGYSTWNLNAVGVAQNFATSRLPETGDGVYVAVLDTGLVNNWPSYFPTERIAVTYARSFGGGGGDNGTVSTQPNKWGEDQDSHGTHVTSTIIGYQYWGAYAINGVAPKATIIPVKVLNQNGSGWSSVIARGITYIGDLKAGELADHPVVINMSLGGGRLDPMEAAAIDYAIEQGVIVVASAGNEGEAGMGYPGAYQPVISVAASGWVGEWASGAPAWYYRNFDDATDPNEHYITAFSSRAKAGQDLDVAAPGSWVLGPYQVNGQQSYYFLGGTSMASPHVAGIVALMAEAKAGLTAAQAESILTDPSSVIALAPGCRSVLAGPGGPAVNYCWGADATGAGVVNAPAAIAEARK